MLGSGITVVVVLMVVVMLDAVVVLLVDEVGVGRVGVGSVVVVVVVVVVDGLEVVAVVVVVEVVVVVVVVDGVVEVVVVVVVVVLVSGSSRQLYSFTTHSYAANASRRPCPNWWLGNSESGRPAHSTPANPKSWAAVVSRICLTSSNLVNRERHTNYSGKD